MASRLSGTYVIAWQQTKVDGRRAAPLGELSVGSVWSWSGEAVRIDGPRSILPLEPYAADEDAYQARATRQVADLLGKAAPRQGSAVATEWPSGPSFSVTDGLRLYRAGLVEAGGDIGTLAVFAAGLPPAGREMWVRDVTCRSDGLRRLAVPAPALCFVAGTRIATPEGEVAVERLRPGDLVDTADDGPQPVIWCYRRRLSGARLFAMPDLRPVTFRSGALGGRIAAEISVSPDHRVLVSGDAARALFGEAEVLVAARDLLDLPGVMRDLRSRSVEYVHLMLPAHALLMANGSWSESFHPADLPPDALTPDAAAALEAACRESGTDPASVGPRARRCLSHPEAAILCYKAA